MSNNYDTVNKSPINRSPSKAMYSFSKAPRFGILRNSASCGCFYNIPSAFSHRGASIGKGQRYDFTQGAKNKSPCFYYPPGCFDMKKYSNARCSFGVGRDAFSKIDINIPGPAKYNVLKSFGSDAVKYSIGRGNSSFLKDSDSPGPGQYQEKIQINPDGVFPSSKNHNIRQVFFGSGKRFNYQYDQSPGPAAYKQAPLMGDIFSSKYTSHPGISIVSRKKIINSNEDYPGPGKYNAFSEFGSRENLQKNNGKKVNKSCIIHNREKSSSSNEEV